MSEPRVQLVSESGVVTGSADMIEAFDKDLIRHTIHVMLVNPNGDFLLQKRSSVVPNYKNHWDASAGGHVDEGEAHKTAAYRELSEELGLDDIELSHQASFYFESAGDGRMYKYYTQVYTGAYVGGNLPVEVSDEVSDVGLFSRDEINNLDKVTPITKYIVSLL